MTKKLLFSVTIHDCRVDTFTVGGHGGAGKDTSNTGVRVTHTPSMAFARASDTRSQTKNKALAFRRMAETQTFKRWHREEVRRKLGEKSVEAKVDEDLDPKNLLIEFKCEVCSTWVKAPYIRCEKHLQNAGSWID